MKINQSRSNYIWSFVGFVVNLIVSFYLTSYVSETIGIEANGFIELSNTIISYLNVVSSALNAFAARYVSLSYFRGDTKKANKYYSSVVFANIVLVILYLLIGTPLVINLNKVLSIPENLSFDVKILFFIILLNYSVSLINTSFKIACFIKNKLNITYFLETVSTIIKTFLLIFLFISFPVKVYFVSIATIVASVCVLVSDIFISRRYLPEIRFNIKDFSIGHVASLFKSGIWNSINSLGLILNSGLDLLITNQYLGSTQMGILSVSSKITSIVVLLANRISLVYQPTQMKLYSNDDIHGLVSNLKKSMNVCGIMIQVYMGGFVALGLTFLRFWIPSQEIELIFILIILGSVGNVVVCFVTPLYYVNTMSNKLKTPCIVTILNGLFNFGMMVVLLSFTQMGIYAVLITTIICNLLINLIFIPFYEAHILNVGKFSFYPTVVRNLFSTGLCVLLGFTFKTFVPPASNVFVFVLEVFLVGSLLMMVSVLTTVPFREIKSFIKKRLKKNVE